MDYDYIKVLEIIAFMRIILAQDEEAADYVLES